MRRLQIPDVETLLAAVQDEISHTAEGRYYHRLHVILHVLKGASCYEAAKIYSHSPRYFSILGPSSHQIWSGWSVGGEASWSPKSSLTSSEGETT